MVIEHYLLERLSSWNAFTLLSKIRGLYGLSLFQKCLFYFNGMYVYSLNNVVFHWLLQIYLVLHLNYGIILLRDYIKHADYFAFTCKLKGQFLTLHGKNCRVEDMAQWQSTWWLSRPEIWIYRTHNEQGVVTNICYIKQRKKNPQKLSVQITWFPIMYTSYLIKQCTGENQKLTLSIYLHECVKAHVPTLTLKKVKRIEIDHDQRESFCNHLSVSMSCWWWWASETHSIDNPVFCGQCRLFFF